MKSIFLFLIFSCTFHYYHAAIIVVNTTNDSGSGSLRESIANANAGDTIHFNPQLLANGTNTINVLTAITITKSITIKGIYNNSDTLYISGRNLNQIFKTNFTTFGKNVTLDSVCLIKGKLLYQDGAALNFAGDTLTIKNSIIKNNTADYGGAISCQYPLARIFIINSILSNNYAASSGGAVYCSNFDSILTVEGSVFSTNSAPTDEGGGIHCFKGIITNSTLTKNSAKYGGGISSLNLTMNNCTLSYNTASLAGGAIYHTNSNSQPYKFAVDHSSIWYNSAPTGGGLCVINSFTTDSSTVNNSSICYNTATNGAGIYGSGYNPYIILNYSILSNNTAIQNGGGINIRSSSYTTSNAKVIVRHSTLENNLAENGGSIYSDGNLVSSTVQVENSFVRHNTATTKGGGIYSYSNAKKAAITIANSTVSHNSAIDGGGLCALSNSEAAEVNTNYSTIEQNTATNGGGIHVNSFSLSCTINANNSIIRNNTSSQNGGGIYCSTGGAYASVHSTIRNSTISDNQANQSGGAIYTSSYSYHSTIENTTFNNNSAYLSGGGCYFFATNSNAYSAFTIFKSTFSNNRAITQKGGGVYCTSNYVNSTFSVDNSTFSNNTAALNGGGIFTYTLMNLKNSTVCYNSATNGAGIFSQARINSVSNIIALNSGNLNLYNTYATAVNSTGYNIFGDAVVTGSISSDIVGANAGMLNLGQLQYNGGLTNTVLPAFNSIAVNSGNPTDQSTAQNRSVINRRDIGAAEYNCIHIEIDTVKTCSYYNASNGITYDETGTYTIENIPNDTICDSIKMLNLTILNTAVTIEQTSCGSYTSPSGNYTWTASGIYKDTVLNSLYCDSIITLLLTIKNDSYSTVNKSECESYTSPSGNYTWISSGTYMDTIPNTAGCDSIIQIHLTINHHSTGTKNITSCNSYTWADNGLTYTSSGTYFATIPTIYGCDSLITLNLTLNHSNTGDTSVTACDGYTWYGTTYTTSSLPTHTFTNVSGCDSVVTLHLTINHNYQLDTIVTACDSFTWRGVTHYNSANPSYNYTTVSGCDSTEQLFLTLYHSNTGSINITACDSYLWPDNGITYTSSGTYSTTIPTAHGCDSTITLQLQINHSNSSDTVAVACTSFTWYGTTYTSSATPTHLFTNVSGCDSLVTLHLTINYTNTGDTSVVACTSFTWYGTTYTSSATPTHLFTNVSGCDSLVTLHLTINYANTGDTSAIACTSFTWYGTAYTSSATPTHLFTNVSGCDSLVTLHLTINYTNTGDTSAIACTSFTWYGTTYTSSATPTHLFTNISGCDSLVTLHLTINTTDTSVTQIENTLLSNAIGANYQWLDCSNNLPVTGENNSSFNPIINGNYAVEVTKNGCVDTSGCYLVSSIGILENTFSKEIHLYPNPTKGNVLIDLDNHYEKVELWIMDITGKRTQQLEFNNSNTLNFSLDGIPGMYFVKIASDEKEAIIKVVKE